MLPDFNNPKGLKNHKTLYRWKTFPAGVKRETFSKIDALFEIVALETGDKNRTGVLKQLGLHSATVSRARVDNTLADSVVMRAALYSGAPYLELCEALGEEPVLYPHRKEVK